MEADGGIGVGSSLETPHWAARIRRADGKIAGTGILLSPDRVLTCAHVVAEGERVTAEFVGAPGRVVPCVPARVLSGAYRPETRDADGDPSGDVALLGLDRPMPVQAATSLYRLSAPNRQVRMYGFPESYNGGIWLRATIIGGCGRDGQVQLAPHTPGEPARPGFSGGGVVDIVTGEVIGMVLSSAPERAGGGFSFMSPAETIVRHLPRVAAWTRGRTAVDEQLYSKDSDDEEPPFDEQFAQRLADWLRGDARDLRDSRDGRDLRDPRDGHDGRAPRARPLRRDSRQVKISLVRPGDRARAATLRRAITLADRELRTGVSADRASLDPPETVPAAGGLDLAVDATGHSTERIAERIAERMGLWHHGERPVTEQIGSARQTLTLVMVGVDEAADPATLLDLLALLREQGSRLLLVFRAAGPHYARAQSVLVTGPDERRRARLAERLTEITGPLAEALHTRAARIRTDTDRAVAAVIRAHTVRAELGGAAGAGGGRAGPGPGRDLARYERTVDRAQARVRQTIERLDELLARRDELRGRLGPYHALHRDATDHEDLEAEAHYLTAHRLLDDEPCDLAAAEEAVRAYMDFVEPDRDRPPERDRPPDRPPDRPCHPDRPSEPDRPPHREPPPRLEGCDPS